jgi:hypothetical protein
MKALKTALIGAILVMGISSCGNSESVAVETTTTISYGKDCNEEAVLELDLFIAAQEFISGLSSGFPSANHFGEEWKAFSDVRSYVRGLDVPLLQSEQTIYVGAMTDFILAYQRYYESRGQDLMLNNYIMPYNDAEQDFRISFRSLCAEGLLSGSPSQGSYDPNDPWGLLDNRNCADIGSKVWVGSDDDDNLDADGDGWGCESYGG